MSFLHLPFVALLSALLTATVADERQRPAKDAGAVRIGAGAPLLRQPVLDPEAAPSRNFDLSGWKLTIPSGEDISSAKLRAGYVLPQAFFTDPRTGGMVFRCPNLAGTTRNSRYSRTELREMRRPGLSAKSDANNWTPEEGGSLRARLRIDHVSRSGDDHKRGRVIVGQIHARKSEVVRLYYEKEPDQRRGRIYAGLDTPENKTHWSPDIVGNADDAGIALGETFDYEIRLRGRQLRVTIRLSNGLQHVYEQAIDPGYLGESMYFKAGVYNQNNTGDRDDYVQATFLALERSHP